MLFASQAATAIATAPSSEPGADLKALVDTSPIGVAVFDARTGNLKSLNREMTRLVESLRTPGHPSEALLKVITGRRADGREIALDRLPLAHELSVAETVRAEEIVLSVPDGRSVVARLNATPDSLGGRHGRVGRGHDAGPRAASGAGAIARGVPGHGKPRVCARLLTSIKGASATVLATAGIGSV